MCKKLSLKKSYRIFLIKKPLLTAKVRSAFKGPKFSCHHFYHKQQHLKKQERMVKTENAATIAAAATIATAATTRAKAAS